MVRVCISLIIFSVPAFFFLKVENAYVRNNFICSYNPKTLEKVNQIYTAKFKQILPNTFPVRRLEYLSEKILTQPQTNQKLTCNEDEKRNYESSLLFSLRSQFYPIFPDSLETLNEIAVNQRDEGIMLNQIEKFKQVVFEEKKNFASFKQDCILLKDLSEQVKLLEKHLKIEQQNREPSQVKKMLSRIHKNIGRQLEFAKNHLQANEKIFLTKWKLFFDFESENILCPR